MTEFFRITGLNNITFDQATPGAYRITGGSPPTGMSRPLTRQEVLGILPRLPLGVRGHVLKRGLSIITCDINIQGNTDILMEQARHDLTETLEDATLYTETRGARGTEAVLQYMMDNVVNNSYKTIFHGTVDEMGGRDVLGSKVKESLLQDMKMTLYCEPYWHPVSSTSLLPVDYVVYNHDDADATHDNYKDVAAGNALGDVPSRIRVTVTDGNMDGIKFVYVARRSQGTVANFDHWLEAESAALTNWSSVADTNRSNGNIITDSANTSGNAEWTISSNLTDYKGTFSIYASLWTDDITNTSVLLDWLIGDYPTYQQAKSQWVKKASTWQLIRLGQITLDDSLFRAGLGLSSLRIRVSYTKDAADTVKMDYIMLFPEDESAFRVDAGQRLRFGQNYDAVEVDGLEDFPGSYVIKQSTRTAYAPATLKGNFLSLQPGVANRIYFKALRIANDTDTFDDHIDLIDNDGAPASYFDIIIEAMPQYISPLE